MNALLRAFVRLGHKRYHALVFGIKDGYLGLVRASRRLASRRWDAVRSTREIMDHAARDAIFDRSQDIVLLDDPSVGGIIDRGGIILGSSRCQEFFDAEVRGQVVRLLDALGIDRLVVVGGEGSLKGAAALVAESRLRVIGIPASIDNDYPLSRSCLGVDTAINTVVAAVRNFNDTAGSHHRIMVLEIMGRDCGHLAETAALASGAEIVVTPERGPMGQLKMEGIAKLMEKGMLSGRSHAIVLLAEGVKVDPPSPAGPTKTLADFLQAHFNGKGNLSRPVEVRYSVLGHLQRGGTPTAADRLLAADFAEAAWEHLVAAQPRCGVLGVVQGQIQLQDFNAVLGPEHAAQLSRVYQLQKDVSKYSVGSMPPKGTGPFPPDENRDGPRGKPVAPTLRGRRRTNRTKPLTTERRT